MKQYSLEPVYQCHDFGDIIKFHILLGPACNMQCRHCSQTPLKILNRFKIGLSEKCWEAIKSYMEYALKQPPNNWSCPTRKVIFWGGEALLHWDVIKKIVLRAKKEFGTTYSKYFQFSIISNGLLLTQDKVDFINENHIGFCFSYDAPHPFAIRDFVSNDICNLVRKINRYGVHCSLNAINSDLLLAYYCLREKFPESIDIDINMNLMQAPGIPEDIYDWNWDAVRNNIRKTRIATQLGNQYAKDEMHRYWLHSIFENKSVKYGSVENCSIGNALINCTLDGEVLACYNSFDHIGTVEDSIAELHRKSVERLNAKKSPDCEECRHADICHGNLCWVNAQNEKNQFYACHNYWFKFFDILKGELVKLSLPLTKEDKSWYEEQEKIMQQQVQEFLAKYN